MITEPALITSIVTQGHSVRLETEEFERKAWRAVLDKRPAAVLVSRSYSPDPARLVRLFKRYFSTLSASKTKANLRSGAEWHHFIRESLETDWHLKRSFPVREVDTNVFLSVQRGAARQHLDMQLLIPGCREEKKNTEFQTFVKKVVDEATLKPPGLPVRINEEENTPSGGESANREKLRKVRRQMLDTVGTLTSEELAASGDSMSPNASQYALDQRKKGRIFGVRFGQKLLYPKFQFDTKRRILPEMKEVLAALSPDEKGWDRLQWFLEPHEALKGKSPLEVWPSHKKKVLDAAKTERWSGRD
jgi:hypothetical protein